MIFVLASESEIHRCLYHKYLSASSNKQGKLRKVRLYKMMTRRYKLMPAVDVMTKQSQRRVSHLQLHSPSALSWIWHIRRVSKNMDYTLALLLSLLQLSVGTAAPVPVEVVKMKSKVKWMAEQLVVKVDKDFPVTHGTLFVVNIYKSDGASEWWSLTDLCACFPCAVSS